MSNFSEKLHAIYKKSVSRVRVQNKEKLDRKVWLRCPSGEGSWVGLLPQVCRKLPPLALYPEPEDRGSGWLAWGRRQGGHRAWRGRRCQGPAALPHPRPGERVFALAGGVPPRSWECGLGSLLQVGSPVSDSSAQPPSGGRGKRSG